MALIKHIIRNPDYTVNPHYCEGWEYDNPVGEVHLALDVDLLPACSINGRDLLMTTIDSEKTHTYRILRLQRWMGSYKELLHIVDTERFIPCRTCVRHGEVIRYELKELE